MEIVVLSPRIINYTIGDSKNQRVIDLYLLDSRRERAYVKILAYKAMVTRAHNKKVIPQPVQVGDLVLKKIEVSQPVGKLEPRWEGSYKVVANSFEGAVKLETMGGKILPRSWNFTNLRKFYP